MKANLENTSDPEPMQYAMLGEDTRDDAEKLEKYAGEADWSYLKKHFEAGTLLYVDASVDLLSVGKALADDDTESVLAWKKTGDLIQPSQPHATHWEAAQSKFRVLVVSPFVLIQDLTEELPQSTSQP